MNEQQTAELFLASIGHHDRASAIRLGMLMHEFGLAGRHGGIESAKAIYREMHPGRCRMFSEGLACECFLCRCDEAK